LYTAIVNENHKSVKHPHLLPGLTEEDIQADVTGCRGFAFDAGIRLPSAPYIKPAHRAGFRIFYG